MGTTPARKEKLFGHEGLHLANTMLYLAIVTVYRRFLYNVNSGDQEYDLVKSYKQSLIEKIYINFIPHKSNNNISLFTVFWGEGSGVFVIADGRIDLRL
jgi:hypothetical protein